MMNNKREVSKYYSVIKQKQKSFFFSLKFALSFNLFIYFVKEQEFRWWEIQIPLNSIVYIYAHTLTPR